MVFSYSESGGVSVALQPHQPNLSCSMSGIPTNLMHNLTCLVEASNLSCSQVIWRQQLITTALHAQIKTWLWAICRSGWAALPAVRSRAAPRPAVKPVPGAGCEAGPQVRLTPADTHHGLQPFPHTHSCIVLARTKGWSDTGNQQGNNAAEPQKTAGSLGELFSVLDKGSLVERGTNLTGLGTVQEEQIINREPKLIQI